ncbi:MAG: phenylacetate--CoA ligase family protein [Burkholderiales bacterium]
MTTVVRSIEPVEWEAQDWNAMLPARQRVFEKQWAYLWQHSKYYRRTLAAAGLRADRCPSLADLSDVPFTWKDDFRASQEHEPPFGEHLAAERSSLRQIQTSSGTTGRPMAIAFTAADAEASSEILRRGYVSIGFRPGDTVLHAFSMSRAWIGGLCMVEGYLRMGATVLPIGAEAGRDKILEMMQMFRPSCIGATPGFLLNLGLRAQELGIDSTSLGLRQMLTGGEPGGGIPSVRAQISELFGCSLREVMGGTDFYPMVWAECPAQSGMHFLAADYGSFEIVDPNTGGSKSLEEGAVGEIVYTHLQREAVPILRFRHRDIVQVTRVGRCECGRSTPQIRCIGRADDMMIVKGVNLFPSAVRAVVGEHPGLGPEFRIVKPKGHYTLPGPVKLKVEATPDSTVTAQELAKTLQNRLSVSFEVSFVPPGSTIVPGAIKSGYFEET